MRNVRGGRAIRHARKVRRRVAYCYCRVRIAAPKLTLYYLQGGRVDKFTGSLPSLSLLCCMSSPFACMRGGGGGGTGAAAERAAIYPLPVRRDVPMRPTLM